MLGMLVQAAAILAAGRIALGREAMTSTIQADVELSASCEVNDNTVLLRYTLVNRTNAPVFVFDILHGEIGEDGIFPIEELPYAALEGTSVVLSKKIAPVPPGMFVEKRNIPFVTRILPGAPHNAALQHRLPIQLRGPYDIPDDPSDEQSVRVLPAYFELGYFVGKPGTDELARSYATTEGPKAGFDSFPEASQKLVRTGPVADLAVAVA